MCRAAAAECEGEGEGGGGGAVEPWRRQPNARKAAAEQAESSGGGERGVELRLREGMTVQESLPWPWPWPCRVLG